MPTGKESKVTLGFYTIGIVALFLVGFFLLVIFGATSYRDTVAGQYTNMDTRAQLSYLATTVRANDTVEAISLEGTEEHPILIVRDGFSGYAFRIYLHDGNLMEDYAKTEDPLQPDVAQVIGKSETLSASLRDGVLILKTNAGRVLLSLRSEGGDQ